MPKRSDTVLIVGLMAACFGLGCLVGRRSALPLAADRRLAEDAEQQDGNRCALEALLGLQPHESRAAVAQFTANLPARARAWQAKLIKHPGSRTILQDAFVRFHHLLFQHVRRAST